MATTPRGRFVWHELMTSDPAAAQGFYTKVVGWSTQPWGPDGSYTLWMNGEAPVGGCLTLPAEVKAMGAPPHWLTYIGTPNVDATCVQVKSLGGKVLKDPQDIPNAGRFAVIADPQGTVFGVYTSSTETPASDGPPPVGEFSWHELITTDPNGALGLYGSLFGWKKTSELDMGPAGMYVMYGLSEAPMGGIYKKPPEIPVPNWLPYAKVKSADASAEKIQGLGGKILHGPMEVPGGDRIAVAMDPQGAAFAVHSSKG